jgi:hypothetical protein
VITASIALVDNTPRLKLSGIPEHAVVSDLEVQAIDRMFTVQEFGFEAEGLVLRPLSLQVVPAPKRRDTESNLPMPIDMFDSEVSEAHLESLDGFRGRTDTTAHLRSTGTFATAHLFLTECPPGEIPGGLDGASTQQNRIMHLRVTFPLSPEAIEALTALTKDEAK